MGKRFKKVKNWLPRQENTRDDIWHERRPYNPLYAAQENPDTLSDEQAMYPERDFDEETAVSRRKAAQVEQIYKALPLLTEKQKKILAMMCFYSQSEAARRLKISQPTLHEALASIKKKIGDWHPIEL